MNLPNLLTLLRLALIPVLVGLLAIGESPGLAIGAAAIFSAAAFTDWLDGYVARRRKEVTDLGKLLDPIADKLLILSALVMLVEAGRAPGWLVILILAREFAVTGLRAVAAAGGRVLAAERLGKLKMVAQTIAVLVLILDPVLPVWAHTLGLGLLLAATALAILSASRYAVQYGRSPGPEAAR